MCSEACAKAEKKEIAYTAKDTKMLMSLSLVSLALVAFYML